MTPDRSRSTGRTSGTSPAVAGRFPDLGAARHAIEALENAGVDGGGIELLGNPVEAARTPSDPEIGDRRVGQYLAPRLVRGIARGVVLGALLGIAVGLVLIAVADLSSTVGVLLVSGLAGVLLGGILGVFLSLERSVGFSAEWPLTFEDAPAGPVWVGVFTHDRGERERAGHVLRQQHALELRPPAVLRSDARSKR